MVAMVDTMDMVLDILESVRLKLSPRLMLTPTFCTEDTMDMVLDMDTLVLDTTVLDTEFMESALLMPSQKLTPTCTEDTMDWNLGFLLGVAIILQIITGIFLGLHYTSDLNSAYYQIFFLIREVYYGRCLRYFHSTGASFVFLFLFLHLGRAISYGSYFYSSSTWFSGILLFFFLMATAFMGYVLPFGQMSFWGATVITNLLSPFPSLVEWVCGGHCVYYPTLKRFFLFHFIFPFLLFLFFLFLFLFLF